jgi:hypothetical protein
MRTAALLEGNFTPKNEFLKALLIVKKGTEI